MVLNKSDQFKELPTALAKAQAELGNPRKDSSNPFFKSRYASLEAIVAVLKHVLPKYGISYLQGISEAKMVTLVSHQSGEWIELGYPLVMDSDKKGMQAVQSAATYARKGSLLGAFGLAPAEDDDGNLASHGSSVPQRAPQRTQNRSQSYQGRPTPQQNQRPPQNVR